MASSRKVWLADLRMDRTWSGLMAGTPEYGTKYTRERDFEGEKTVMRKAFSWVEADAFYVVDEGWKALPRFRWFGLFGSSSVHEHVGPDVGDWESRLCICWFTHTLPTNFHKGIDHVLSLVDWDKHSVDYKDRW